MKKTKVVLAMVCAVLLVAASVMGTLAYLTSKATVTNSFTVGNVTLGNTNEAGLDEAKTNDKGVPLDKNNNVQTPVDGKYNLTVNRVTANTYKLQPGHTYVKDPIIHVGDNSDDCYLFVKVVNGIAAIEDSSMKIESQMATKGWKKLGTGYDNIWVYVGTETDATNPKSVSKGNDVPVFDNFKVADTVTDVSAYSTAQIVVTAYGVQVDGFSDKTATQIWDAAFAAETPVTPAQGGDTPTGGDGGSETPVDPAE